MTSPTVTRVLDAQNYLGETPVWSEADQALWWINCEQPAEIHRFVPATKAHSRWPMDMRVGGIVMKKSGGLLVAMAGGIYDFDHDGGAIELRVPTPLPDAVKLHECVCDRQGRFWIGAFDHRFPADRSAAGGSYFRLDGDMLTPVIDQVSVANGLAFSPDGKTMYAGDSGTRSVRAYDLDPATGAISNGRPFVTLEAGAFHVDGATVDSEGGYWLALFGGSALRRYRPDGTLDREVPLPFSGPTKPAFGGPDLKTLYVTSTRLPINPGAPGFAANGGLFAFEPGETGVPDTPFAG